MLSKCIAFAFLCMVMPTILTASPIELPPAVAVGGGWSDAGPMGEYFAGSDLSGTPTFTRREVRLDFDWGTLAPIGGSTAEPYHSFPHDNFSARWTGEIIPRFSEPYRFVITSDAAVTLSLKDGQNPAQSLKLSAGDNGLTSEPIPLQAGARYQLVLEYRHTTGNASCSFLWTSASVPLEVIDPVVEQGLNLASFEPYCFADITKIRTWTDAGKMTDDNGQLKLSDGDYLFAEASHSYKGTYLLSFNGQAHVSRHLFDGKFIVNGKETNDLPRGMGYDPSANTTTALLTSTRDDGTFNLRFNDAVRDAGGTQPGITNLHIMRPIEEGSDQPHRIDEVTYRPMKRMASYFTTLRWLHIANVKCSGLWKDRTLPTSTRFTDRGTIEKPTDSGGENWEYLIMFANESGRDLYLCTPMTADDEYFRNLALLLCYGSDGVNPYTQPTAHPVYPPLNPNLKVTFEVGNEIWNWAFPSSKAAEKMTADALAGQTSIGQIINYDGKGSDRNANYRRFDAIRTVTASNIFREVFGDAAMGHRIRPLIEFQYANANNTAGSSFDFLDGYYNNGNGQHVKDPHPARYYVWGSGGAAYYGVGNAEGTQKEVTLKDSSFEDQVIAEGDRSSPPGAWKFKEPAGIYRELAYAITSYTLGAKISQPANSALGMSFRTGDKPLWVYRLGRVYTQGNDKGARISILRADDKSLVATGETGPLIAGITKVYGFYWGNISGGKPVELAPNTDYLLLTQDVGEASRIRGPDTPVVCSSDITNVKAVTAMMHDPLDSTSWKLVEGKEGYSCGPVNILYAHRPDLVSDLPQPPDGQQAAYISGAGEISQDVDFTKAGTYALSFNIGRTGLPPKQFRVYFDQQNISPHSQADYKGDSDTFNIGGFGRNGGFKEEWGSSAFTVDKPGIHTIRFAGIENKKDEKSYLTLDNITITSADAIMESGFGSGSALGQPEENRWGKSQTTDSRFGWSLGLPRVAYESGWSVGGDFNQKPIQAYCKLADPRAGQINDQAISIFEKAGGQMQAFGVYTYWPMEDFAHGQDCPIMKSIIHAGEQLPAEPENGLAIPATLTPDNCINWGNPADLSGPGKWLSWTIISPGTTVYRVATQASGDGQIQIEADGMALGSPVAGSPSQGYLVRMTKGLHGIRIRNLSGSTVLKQITVAVQ